MIKPFSAGKSAVLREPAEPSISNASRDAANLTPVNSGLPTPTKLFFALGAFCAGCCSRQPVYKRLLPEAHHEEVAACASFGLLTLSGGLCLPVQHGNLEVNFVRPRFRGFGINNDRSIDLDLPWTSAHPKPPRLLRNLLHQHRNTHCRNRCLLGRYIPRLPSG